MKLVIEAGQLVTSDQVINEGRVIVEDGQIVACGSRKEVEASANCTLLSYPEGVLAPGYIDLHIHGAVGYDCMDSTLSGLRAMAAFLAQRGVTSFLPTTTTAPAEQMQQALKFLGKHSGKQIGTAKPISVPLGVHLEGPFLSPARRGVHPPMHLQDPSPILFESFWEASDHSLRMLTVAPELDGALQIARRASDLGVRVAIGHSNANFDQAQTAINAGVSHATHTFNAMRRMDHRDPGVLGAILVDDRITADVIADGIHVTPPMLDLFLRSKGRDLALLISDANHATGLPEGTYRVGSFAVEVRGLYCESHGKLAGSVLTLDCAVRNVMQYAGWKLAEAVRLATLNPARVLGIEKQKGSIHPGADADLIVLTPNGEVAQTFISGEPL